MNKGKIVGIFKKKKKLQTWIGVKVSAPQPPPMIKDNRRILTSSVTAMHNNIVIYVTIRNLGYQSANQVPI